jgi:hypothetical protein
LTTRFSAITACGVPAPDALMFPLGLVRAELLDLLVARVREDIAGVAFQRTGVGANGT